MVIMVVEHVNMLWSIMFLPSNQRMGYGEDWNRSLEQIVPAEMTLIGAFSFVIRSVLSSSVITGFTFLMGVGIQLLMHSRQRQKWSAWAIWRFFLMRGVVIAVCCNAVNALSGLRPLIGQLLLEGSLRPWSNSILFALGISMVIDTKS